MRSAFLAEMSSTGRPGLRYCSIVGGCCADGRDTLTSRAAATKTPTGRSVPTIVILQGDQQSPAMASSAGDFGSVTLRTRADNAVVPASRIEATFLSQTQAGPTRLSVPKERDRRSGPEEAQRDGLPEIGCQA